ATSAPIGNESASSSSSAATASDESPRADEPSRNATETSDTTESTGTANVESAIDASGAEEGSSAQTIPADGLLLASLDAVQGFFRQQRNSEEWFEVYTGPGRALRRLKIGDLDSENGVVNFANRTGQAKLSLPLGQVLDDLFAERTRLVFGNPRFARALALLRERLEEHRDEH
ncbi:MAG: hypothetical protein ABR561_02800, partial [Guyparkeria sp.]